MEKEEEDNPMKFEEMGLDNRILKAVAKLGWTEPTLIQAKAIPLLLDGKDVLMRARTGSGKTAAFAIPVVQNILIMKQVSDVPSVKTLVMAPSKELCHQLHMNFLQLTMKCSRDIKIVDISPKMEVGAQAPLLAEQPDIVVATPARVLAHLRAATLSLASLRILIVDEADLMFSFGYGDNLKEVVKFLPKVYQACLASATLSDEVTMLKTLVLHNTVTLRLREPELAPITQLSHRFLHAEEEDKATILYTLLKLRLVHGKTIVFTNTVDKSYKLKLFLEQFGIKTCVLNSELPSAVRCHSVFQFNEGIYDTIIASDELALEKTQLPESSNKRKRKKDEESGASRGIDFQEVANIINFDFPLDINSYIHRAGRTARGTNSGTAISLVSIHEIEKMNEVDNYLKSGLGERDSIFKKYDLKLEDIEGFKYRAKDAWRATTRIAVREARLKEIKQEMLNSHKLKGHFEDNPKDLKTLRHDKALHTVKIQPHLSNVPDYLLPDSLRSVVDLTHIKKAKRKYKPASATALKYKAKRKNILLSFDASSFQKSESS